MSYTKLFSHIITSTVWRGTKDVKVLWVTMLALKNKHGEVLASVPGLADMARLTLEETIVALAVLEEPDEWSRTPDEEGRRIIKIKGGWLIVNHQLYRKMESIDEEKENNADRQKRWRQRHKNVTPTVTESNASVTHSNEKVTQSDTDTEYRGKEKSTSEEKGGTGGKGRKPSASPKGPTLTDDLFLSELKRHYPGIDIDREIHRMDAWLLTPKAKGRQRTRRFVVNWLNKCDQPMNGHCDKKEWRKPHNWEDDYKIV